MLNSYILDAPTLDWGNDGVPRSNEFDDVYFDKEAGLEESKYVFLKHNNLEERFKALSAGQTFNIAETGFGTGLNFLCAIQLFQNVAPKNTKLHFVSVEKYPLTKDVLKQALKSWPSLQTEADALIKDYPELCQGLHHMDFIGNNISLSLYFGEASEGFQTLNGKIDAWFLDGFAPSKNPEMWSESLFSEIERLSYNTTTFATFTAAGIVRRGLKSHGFDVQKVKGFGHKREMAIGHYVETETASIESNKPWFHVRNKALPTNSKQENALIVGAGIAGATTARALAEQGLKVQVWEASDRIANGASGNIQGMLYPKLANQDTPVNRYYLASYLYANRYYHHYQNQSNDESSYSIWWNQCGLLQKPKNTQEADKLSKIIEKRLYPESIVSALPEGGLNLPLSGWVKPSEACVNLLTHENIHVSLSRSLKELKKTTRSECKFDAIDKDGSLEHFDYVVICTANDHQILDQWLPLQTKAIRGQVTHAPIAAFRTAEASGDQVDKKLSFNSVICGQGYVSPPLENHLNFGATYDLKNTDSLIRNEDHIENLEKLRDLLTIETDNIDISKLTGRAALRCTVPDYCPIVGPIMDRSHLISKYSTLSKNAKWETSEEAPFVEGLFVNIGHGSRGFVSAPLSARYLAALITDQIAPLEQICIETLHPSRFTVRGLKRGEA
ncbi:bifunctional tRNA (5-methylaminomethyl-2-thiouridine)(34)-methyltransferase MnmD/FAD-dependent 5-carboxymethylaminomethyl-2-thiouridine(34) oxidoreductase MnmC [Marinomonas balearica]|uniref:tRNA 5-methylaminomethyl-2-thiouridine biosynthesis bifunctional protein MnmC n=1 Tax=Marinomonas balearica TaxID=491947 RepID=A0A4R6M528_9GAMM|nr:bifunctional tRNA (5-methylaminomethyl-2-thiouridine)(34)-methyltransferase MnmD/FAD-dependent 5-carboxymethylaminomethyl-2-thiouridine(34) oxidoreductase MnmC [Marinomonas balearica]TDO96438.1 tRNA 5-methylaminomethyl-2-thiouridine biosynthesis bifunctional protein [Marinomonas balearica]